MDDIGQDLADARVRLAIQQGSPVALDFLYRECSAWLRRKAGWLVDSASDADDAASETWRRVFKDPSRYDPTWSPRTWLARILGHVCIDMTRYAERRSGTPVEGEPTAPEEEPRLDRAMAVRALREAILRLPVRQRVVVRLSFFGPMPVSEIARVLGEKPTVVHNRLERATRNLGRLLRRAFPDGLPF